ncbi:MAG: hypothetical protein ACLSVD_07545 [Eggerthellaceae bacterium]
MIDQSRFLEYDDTSFLQGVVVDVTETVELRDMMSMLIEHTSSDIVLLSWSDKEDVRVNVVACGASKKYGLSPEQYEDIIRGQLYLPSGDGGGRLVDEIVDKIDRGESLAIVDRPRFPGHENVWMHVEARRVGLESSERIALCLVTDVTTMKNQQQELWLTKRKLEGSGSSQASKAGIGTSAAIVWYSRAASLWAYIRRSEPLRGRHAGRGRVRPRDYAVPLRAARLPAGVQGLVSGRAHCSRSTALGVRDSVHVRGRGACVDRGRVRDGARRAGSTCPRGGILP